MISKKRLPHERHAIILSRDVLTLGAIVFVVLGLFLLASFSGVPTITGNIVFTGTFSCIHNDLGAQVFDANYDLFYQKENACVDSARIRKYSCLSEKVSGWWAALFMTTSNVETCQYGCEANKCKAPPVLSCIDNDGDGFGQNCAAGSDCNDNNAAVYPGASEVCSDTLDNNCNGFVNENCPVCGNGLLESGEECDTNDVGDSSCSSLGFASGSLRCTSSCTFDTSACQMDTVGTLPDVPAKNEIIIGAEYAFDGTGPVLADAGIEAVKFYPETYTIWQRMQPLETSKVNFGNMDRMVKQYQDAGFDHVVVGLRSVSNWGSIDADLNRLTNKWPNPLPKPEYVDEHDEWVRSFVERYDDDNVNDYSGLRRPVKYYEIGVEFSSYEPEPADEYIAHLKRVYTVIHNAYPDARVGHAAFLPLGAFDADPFPESYEEAFENRRLPDDSHGLADMRKVLDHPEAFDFVNVHSLGDPREIDGMVAWLREEMDDRGYEKEIVISDTAITPYAAFGIATTCDNLPTTAKTFYPATDADQCRLAAYFQKLAAGDAEYVSWVQGFAAADTVKRVVIAADNNVELINTAFIEDLELWKGSAGTGNSAWAGLVKTNFFRQVLEKRPGWYALKQLQAKIDGYDRLGRVDVGNDDVRVYLFKDGAEAVYVAWYHVPEAFLPDDPVPEVTVRIPVGTMSTIEHAITESGRTTPSTESLAAESGYAQVTLTPYPVYIY